MGRLNRHKVEMTHYKTLKQITEKALVGHLEGISSLDASPKSENEDTITNFPRFPGEICGNVGFKTQK
jgi:hypothetical protein